MTVDSASAGELAAAAREAGAEVLEGSLRYPSRTGNWQLGDVDLGEHLGRYRDQRLMVVLAPIGAAEREPATCSVCGYVLEEAQECPRCKFLAEYTTDVERRIREREGLFEEVETSP
jgi:hypothetical protein